MKVNTQLEMFFNSVLKVEFTSFSSSFSHSTVRYLGRVGLLLSSRRMLSYLGTLLLRSHTVTLYSNTSVFGTALQTFCCRYCKRKSREEGGVGLPVSWSPS